MLKLFCFFSAINATPSVDDLECTESCSDSDEDIVFPAKPTRVSLLASKSTAVLASKAALQPSIPITAGLNGSASISAELRVSPSNTAASVPTTAASRTSVPLSAGLNGSASISAELRASLAIQPSVPTTAASRTSVPITAGLNGSAWISADHEQWKVYSLASKLPNIFSCAC